MQAIGYQKWLNILMILGGVLLVLFVNGTIISARVEPQTSRSSKQVSVNHISKTEAAPVVAAALPSLQQTAGITLYLPIVIGTPPVTAGCNPTQGSGGLGPGTYITTVAGLNATVIVGKNYDPNKTTYLSFYLHGNDGSYTHFQSSNNQVNKFVNEHNWVFFAAQSPKGSSWSSNWDESVNEAFANALDEMFAKYNVCRGIVIGSAVSGGSIFWTGYFFPYRGGTHQAHVSLLCGALRGRKDAPDKVNQLGQDPGIVARSTFDYIYGTEDYLYDNIQTSIGIYTNAGFNVDQLVIQGAGHCDQWFQVGLPNTSQRIVNDWADRIEELDLE